MRRSSPTAETGFTVQQPTRKVSVRSQDGRVVDEHPRAAGRLPPARR
jgi:hypothetical protein